MRRKGTSHALWGEQWTEENNVCVVVVAVEVAAEVVVVRRKTNKEILTGLS